MNAIQEIKDENVRRVAMTLRSSGLASSETEAVRMAMMVTKTSQKINQTFDQKNNSQNPFQTSKPLNEVIRQETPHTDVFVSVHKSSSVQEKPGKTGEKEEFIFGDVQEKETVQKKDIYKIDNEFEEVVLQEVIITKAAPQESVIPETPKAQPQQKPSMFNGRPSMFGSGCVASSKPQTAQAPIEHVQQVQHIEHPQRVEHVQESHISSQLPSQKPAPTPSTTPVTAASSAQMAFASLLGDVQKTQVRHQEQKPAVQPSPAQASLSKPSEAAPVPQSAPRPIINHSPDPRANMMKEANVDLSKMFNVHK